MRFLHSRGRGTSYSRLRGVVEQTLRLAYVADWPARAWARVPGSCAVTRRDVTIDVAGSGSDLRIAFASDLHLGPTTPPGVLDRAFELLACARPDVLALGGDFVFLDATAAKAEELARRVAAVPARLKIAVLGNHDLWTDHPLLERALASAGVRVLVNEAVALDDVALIGVDDPWTGDCDAEAALRSAQSNVCVAIAHAPEALPALAGRVDALLCGHTHGGQIALPGGRAVIVPGHFGRRFPHGVHSVDGTTLVVSRGVGAVELPIRTFAPPDVVLLTLRRRGIVGLP